MALPRDPETLRVPAFMRKRNIRTRLARPLLLTALDRKNAGVVLPELQKPKRTQRIKKTRNQENKLYRSDNSNSYSWPMLPLHERQESKKSRNQEIIKRTRKPVTRKRKIIPSSSFDRSTGSRQAELRMTQGHNDTTYDYFAEPLIGVPEPVETKPKKSRPAMVPFDHAQGRLSPHHDTKLVGTITHYYGKIEVGVIKLKGALSVGDCISYETPEGDYEQIVESMEIDRVPIFKAKKGDDIGLKLRKEAKVGSKVVKI